MSCANSEVSPVVRLVAVARQDVPAGNGVVSMASITALPVASVVTWVGSEPVLSLAVTRWDRPSGW